MSRLRVCNVDGCPELSPETRCPAHRAAAERARGTRQERGYGVEHDALRAAWAPKVALGLVDCWRCGTRLNPLEPWDLGHLDDRSGYGGPECLGCNRGHRARGT